MEIRWKGSDINKYRIGVNANIMHANNNNLVLFAMSPITPIIGFKIIPVIAEIELIVPIKILFAPRFDAKNGSTNFPDIYIDLLIRSVVHKFIRGVFFLKIILLIIKRLYRNLINFKFKV